MMIYAKQYLLEHPGIAYLLWLLLFLQVFAIGISLYNLYLILLFGVNVLQHLCVHLGINWIE